MLKRACPVPASRKPPLPQRTRAALLAPVGRYLSRQAALPRGTFGHLLARIWVNESAAVNDTAIELLRPAPGERICEIGFGPGRTLERVAAAGAEAIGVEVSPVMLATAARRNAGAIADGRIDLHRGNGTTLPIPEDSLDAVLAVHTVYFWPDPPATVVDAARALRPGGRLVLAFQPGEHPLPARFDREIYHAPTTIDATDWLHAAGFIDVRVQWRPDVASSVVWLTGTSA